MKQLTLKTLIAVPAVLLAITSSHAALVVNDTFDYGGSNLESGYGSWEDTTGQQDYIAGVTASWSGDSDYALNGAGGSAQNQIYGSQTYNRGAQLDFGTALSGTFWMSILIQDTISSSANAGAVVGFENGSYSNANFDQFGFSKNGNGNLATTVPGSGSLSEFSGPVALPAGWGLYVAKLTVGAGDDSISLWSFDDTDSFGSTEASLGGVTYSSITLDLGSDIQAIWLGGFGGDSGSGSGLAQFDNLRVSNLSGDNGLQEVLTGVAIPEPSTYAMLAGLLALSSVIVRRRQG